MSYYKNLQKNYIYITKVGRVLCKTKYYFIP